MNYLHLVLIALLVSLLALVRFCPNVALLFSHPRSPSLEPKSSFHAVKDALDNDRFYSIKPGVLPGYTGWARPALTMAGHYELVSLPQTAVNEKEWNIHVNCRHAKCSKGGAIFDVRAYGPSILPGTVHDYHNGTYSIKFFFLDAGRYTIEVVLAFSDPPPLKAFPIAMEPLYEGYLLPNFPMTVDVLKHEKMKRPSNSPRLCMIHDLLFSKQNPLKLGRWKVVDHVFHGASFTNSSSRQKVSLEGYQKGCNSIGFTFDYFRRDCKLMSESQVAATTGNFKNNNIVVAFVGDSNMRLQHELFQKYHGHNINTTHINTSGGLTLRLDETQRALLKLQKEASKIYILFNSGLHDIGKLCSQDWAQLRATYIENDDASFSCIEQYQHDLDQLATFITTLPAARAVFQTTTAGWPKWGNYGFAWPPAEGQPLPKHPHACAVFNQAAIEIMRKHDILLMDAYWLTLARPDHREVGFDNAIGKHLVHAGPEVYSVLMRQWSMILFKWIDKS